MAASTDLAWVDESLHGEVRQLESYLDADTLSDSCPHAKVLVGVEGDPPRYAWVDQGLAQVVRNCLRGGLLLEGACEGGGDSPETVWTTLQFEDEYDLVAFLDEALPVDDTPGSRHDLAVGPASSDPANREHRWGISAEFRRGRAADRPTNGLRLTLRIPPADLVWLADVYPRAPWADEVSSAPIDGVSPRPSASRCADFDLAEAIARVPDEDAPRHNRAAELDRLLAESDAESQELSW